MTQAQVPTTYSSASLSAVLSGGAKPGSRPHHWQSTIVPRMVNAARAEHSQIVADASRLSEKPGTLDEVARLACDWFGRYLDAAHDSTSAAARRL